MPVCCPGRCTTFWQNFAAATWPAVIPIFGRRRRQHACTKKPSGRSLHADLPMRQSAASRSTSLNLQRSGTHWGRHGAQSSSCMLHVVMERHALRGSKKNAGINRCWETTRGRIFCLRVCERTNCLQLFVKHQNLPLTYDPTLELSASSQVKASRICPGGSLKINHLRKPELSRENTSRIGIIEREHCPRRKFCPKLYPLEVRHNPRSRLRREHGFGFSGEVWQSKEAIRVLELEHLTFKGACRPESWPLHDAPNGIAMHNATPGNH